MSPLTLSRDWSRVRSVDVLLEVLPAVGTIVRTMLYTYLLEVCNNIRSSRNYELIRSHAGPNMVDLPGFTVMEYIGIG